MPNDLKPLEKLNVEKKKPTTGKLTRIVKSDGCANCPFMSEISELEYSGQEEGFAPIYFHKCNLDFDLDIDDYLEISDVERHPDCKLLKEIIMVTAL
jgi:hypothetical protein